MLLRSFLLSAAISAFATGAIAAGCAPVDGETIDQIEQINQMMVESNYDGIATAFREAGIGDPSSVIDTLSGTFPGGFTSCTTLVQRIDAGAAAQSVLVFTSDVGPLYVYFRTAQIDGQFYIINLYLNTDEEKVFAKVF